MDVSSYSPASVLGDYAGPPPVLVAASSDQALDHAATAVAAAGLRLATVTIDEAADRLSIQAAASAVWVEVDEDGGAPLDRLLDRIEAEAASGRFSVVVAAPAALIDPIAARLAGDNVELLVDPARRSRHRPGARDRRIEPACPAERRRIRTERGTASPTVGRGQPHRCHARPAVGRPGVSGRKPQRSAAQQRRVPAVSLDTIRQVIRARRLRARYFDEELFADPAWDMLLDLLQAEIAQHRVPVSSLCIAAAVPATTALRWIKTMTDAGLFRRRADPHDGRRVFIELSREASEGMRRYFGEVGAAAVI